MKAFAVAALVGASCWGACGSVAWSADEPAPKAKDVPARASSTLSSERDNIRMLAFDGKPETAFVSSAPAKASDNFTLRFDAPVKVTKIVVSALGQEGKHALKTGHLLLSTDGETFTKAAEFGEKEPGVATVELNKSPTLALRIQPTEDLTHPLVVSEIAVESDPPVERFRAPVEFVLDSADAPDLAEWLDNAAKACERAYPMICEELKSDGFTPARVIRLKLSNDYEGVAAASGNGIVGSPKYYRGHKDDVGSMVHETAHVVQAYRRRGNPGWLVEGIADYIRFVKYEPQNIGPINARRAKYDGSYRTSAAFLGYVAKTYDADLVRKLNAACRAGEYRDGLFEEYTRKPLADLDAEWRETLK